MGHNPRSAISVEEPVARLLNSSLGVLLGVDVSTDVYLNNAYGLLGLPASASENELNAAAQRFRNSYRVDPSIAFQQSVLVPYGNGRGCTDALDRLGGLRDPRQRLVWELFWPHVPAELFAGFKQAGNLATTANERMLEKSLRRSNANGRPLYDHALAIVRHNLALAREFDYLEGKAARDGKLWKSALDSWARVLNSDGFWRYLGIRIERFDDHRLTSTDLVHLRSQLPAVLLSFHRLFWDLYLTRGDRTARECHSELIESAALPDAARQSVLGLVKRTATAAEFQPLAEKARAALSGSNCHLTRPQFDERCRPLLDEAAAICARQGISSAADGRGVEIPECDEFCLAILQSLSDRLDYQRDQRERNLLYRILIAKQLQRQPVSRSLRQRLQFVESDGRGYLYGDWIDEASNLDPAACWFLEGQEADPDVSLVIDMYKITERRVKVNYLARSAGIEVGFNKRRLLVPRSREAQQMQTELPTGCLSVLLVVILIIVTIVLCQPPCLDQVVLGYREAVAQLQQLEPRMVSMIVQAEQFFDWGRTAVEGQLGQMDIPDVRLHPAALPVLTAWFGFWALLSVGRKIRRAHRAGRLRRTIQRCQRKLDRLAAAGPAKSAKKRKWSEACRTRLLALQSRSAARLKRIESRQDRRCRKHRLKSEFAKAEFPTLRGAKAQGYREGTEPSQTEMQMTYAEQQEAISLLRQRCW